MQITQTRNQLGWQRSLRSSSWIMSYSLSSYAGSVHRASVLQEEMSSCTPLKPCQTLQKRKTVATLHQVKMGLPGSCLDHSGQKVNGMNWPGCIQYAKGSFLSAGIFKSFAITSSCFEVRTTKKHLKRQTNRSIYFKASEAECSKTVP